MHIAMEDHRSWDFPKLTLPLYERLKGIFKTKEGQVVIFPSSGTGAWEAALTNTLAPGNKVLIARFGQFSHLWGELARRHGPRTKCPRGADADLLSGRRHGDPARDP